MQQQLDRQLLNNWQATSGCTSSYSKQLLAAITAVATTTNQQVVALAAALTAGKQLAVALAPTNHCTLLYNTYLSSLLLKGSTGLDTLNST